MTVDPVLAEHLSLLDDVTLEEAMADDSASGSCVTAISGARPAAGSVRDDSALGLARSGASAGLYADRQRPAAIPVFVWLHGGGFYAGDLDQPEADYVSRSVCANAGAVVVSVDYRLAVDGVHYPGAARRCVAAFRCVQDNAAMLGIDPERLSLGGGSAGANLAAAAALQVRDAGETLPGAAAAGLSADARRGSADVARRRRTVDDRAAAGPAHPARGGDGRVRQLSRWRSPGRARRLRVSRLRRPPWPAADARPRQRVRRPSALRRSLRGEHSPTPQSPYSSS